MKELKIVKVVRELWVIVQKGCSAWRTCLMAKLVVRDTVMISIFAPALSTRCRSRDKQKMANSKSSLDFSNLYMLGSMRLLTLVSRDTVFALVSGTSRSSSLLSSMPKFAKMMYVVRKAVWYRPVA